MTPSSASELPLGGTVPVPNRARALPARPASLSADTPNRPSLTPVPGSADRQLTTCQAKRAGDRRSDDFANSAKLTRLDRQALIVGLSDARHRRRTSQFKTGNWLHIFWRCIFGVQGFPPLANPRLEALRDLAMREAGAASRFRRTTNEHSLDRALVLAARRFIVVAREDRMAFTGQHRNNAADRTEPS